VGWGIRNLLTSQHVPHAIGKGKQGACAEAGSAQNIGRRNGHSRIEIGGGASHGALSSVRQSNDELMRTLRSTESDNGKTLPGERMMGIGDRDVRHQPIYDGGVTR
jgi:hypothetical protein